MYFEIEFSEVRGLSCGFVLGVIFGSLITNYLK